MKFCQKCGKQLMDEAVICPGCGCAVGNNQSVNTTKVSTAGETSGIATGALVCSFLIPIVGLLLGIVGACKYKTPEFRNRSIAAIGISILVWVFCGALLSILMYL